MLPLLYRSGSTGARGLKVTRTRRGAVLVYGDMAYYQDIVVEYLRENRAIFVDTECCIRLNEGMNNNIGPHWYCDGLAARGESPAAFGERCIPPGCVAP